MVLFYFYIFQDIMKKYSISFLALLLFSVCFIPSTFALESYLDSYEARELLSEMDEMETRILEIKVELSHLEEDIIEAYPWVPKYTINGIVADRSKVYQQELNEIQLKYNQDYNTLQSWEQKNNNCWTRMYWLYNPDNNRCECYDWHRENSQWMCVETCEKTYWRNAIEDGDYCVCKKWYTWNTRQDACISYKDKCQEKYWSYSVYDEDADACWCKSWYEWSSNWTSCVKSTKTTTSNNTSSNNNNSTTNSNTTTKNNTTSNNTSTSSNNSSIPSYWSRSDILKASIEWMYDNWLTMWNTLPEFLPYDNITREQASKFFVEFDAKVLWKDRWVVYNYNAFSDIKNANPTLKDHIIYANNMGLFKWSNWKFKPFDNLTKAQALAVVVRMVDWYLDEPAWAWYASYFNNANAYWLLKRWDFSFSTLDSTNITRWDVAIILYSLYLYLLQNDKANSTSNYTSSSINGNLITIKYRNDPVDISSFQKHDTSDSSFVEKAYYDANNKYLILNLSWTNYHWCNVPKYIWDDFKTADSYGEYYNKYLRWEYECVSWNTPKY